MFDEDEINQFKLNFDAYRASQPRAVAQTRKPEKKKGGRGGTLTSLISEGGALGGAAGGAALGTAVLPGIGTLLGALGGGFLGGFGGRLTENKVRDNRLGLGDALKEGAVSGVLGAGPLRLGKFGLDAVKGVRAISPTVQDTGTKVFSGGLAEALGRVGTPGASMRVTGEELARKVGSSTMTRPDDKVSSLPKGIAGLLPERAGAPGNISIKGGVMNPSPAPSKANKSAIEAIDKTIANAQKNGGLSATDARQLMRVRQNLAGVGLNMSTGAKQALPAGTANRIINSLERLRPTLPAGTADKVIGAIKTQVPGTISKEYGFTRAITSAEKKTAVKDALVGAGNNAANMSFKRAFGNKLSKAGEGLIAKEFRLSPTQQSNFKNNTGEEAVSVLRRYGVKKPEDLAAKIEPLQNAFDSVVKTIPAVSQKELSTGLAKIYDPLLKSPALFEQQLGQQIKAQADELVRLAKNGSLPAERINELRKTFDAAVRYTQKGAPEYNVIKETADALRGTLQRTAEKAGAKTADGLNFKDLGLELRKLYDLDEIVGKQAYLGTGSLPANLPNLLGAAGGGAAAGGPGGAALGFLGTALANSGPGRRAMANTTLRAGERLTEKAATANPYGVKALTGRIAPVGLAGALIQGGDQSSGLRNTQQNQAMMTNSANQPTAANIPEFNQTDANMSTPNNPLAPENLQSSIQQILANGGSIDDATKFIGLAEALQKLGGVGQSKPLTASQATRAAAANNALRDIPMIAESIDTGKLGGAKMLPGSGTQIGRRLLGTENLDAALFNIADNILRARTGAAAPEAEVKRFVETFLPSATDSTQAKKDKLARAIRELQGYVNPVEASADTLEEVLL